MKRMMMAPIMSLVAVTSFVRAAAPPDNACGAALSSAERFKSAGDLSAAHARLTACLSMECRAQRQECTRRLAAIDAQLPSIVVEVRDEASNYVPNARATMDGAPLLGRLDGQETLVNPGEHRLVVDAAGFRKAEASFVTLERQKRLRVVVFLNSTPSSAPDPSVASSAAAGPPLVRADTPALSGGRKVGLALVYAGIGALAVGTVLSIMSKVTYDHAVSSECDGLPNRCSAQGIAEGQTAHREAAVATIAFATAGVLFATGAVLYFKSPKHQGVAIAPAVDYGSGGLTMVGKW